MCVCTSLYDCVFQNSSSWVLYNMASFYWRMKNEPQRAVDCVVRALHFSPRYCQAGEKATAIAYCLLYETVQTVCVYIFTLCVCGRGVLVGSRRM